MSRAEKFILEYTKNCSNIIESINRYKNVAVVYHPWLTPDDARKAVEITRADMIEKTIDFLKDRLYKNGYVGIIDLCDDYIKAMKDE